MRVLKTFAVSLVLLLGCAINAFSQNREVSGKVLDANQQPLVGAAVLLPGTTTGTVTLEDGSFSLTLPAGDVNVEVSSLGYLTRTVSILSRASSTIALALASSLLYAPLPLDTLYQIRSFGGVF